MGALSFVVESGTVTWFIGRNSAGKTTTINAMAGILRPDAGEVELPGERIKPGDWEYKSRVGFVLEKANYVENFTGLEYLQFACVMQKIVKRDSVVRVGGCSISWSCRKSWTNRYATTRKE